jgi:tRNA dimethylallyltransferase
LTIDGDLPRIAVITGATAVGKSELALALAERWSAEIVSADSRHVYHYLDVGTAKPSLAERGTVPHHLIDVAYPDEPFSVVAYQRLATDALDVIVDAGRVALVVGGSPHYIQALIDRLEPAPRDPSLRRWLDESDARGLGEEMNRWLRSLDPVAGEQIDPRNRRRVLRALEVILTTGRPFSEVGRRRGVAIPAAWIGLRRERGELHERIDRRVLAMLDAGWLDEVRVLRAMGFAFGSPSLSATGYGTLAAVLRGEMTLDQAVERIRIDTHAFARRQETWLRAEPRIHWHDADEPDLMHRVVEVTERSWEAG